MKKIINLVFLTIELKAKYVFFASFLLSLFLFSCVKEGDFEFDKLASNQYNPSIAVPFVSSKLTLKDIIDDASGIVQVNSLDNSLKLVYATDELVSVMAKDLFEIPNQNLLTDTSNMVFSPIPVGDSVYYSITKPYPFNMPKPGQRMDSVFIKIAMLKLDINTDINHDGKIILTTPNITYPNGQTFRVLIPLNYSGGAITQVYKDVDISGCKIKFNNTPGHTNELTFKYEHTIYGDGNPDLSPYYINIDCDIENITYQKLFGYIAQYDFPLKDTLMLDIFSNQLSGQFEFENITVGMTTVNSYGLPIEASIDKFQAQNEGTIVNVTDFPTQNPFNIDYPNINQVGQSIEMNITNQPSAHLADAINISPKKIIYDVNGKANPANDPAIPNFVLDTSNFTVGVNIEIPLEGKVGGFVLQDTLEFDLDNLKDIDEATFRINTWNAFPLTANVQVYFTNIIYGVLDSLVTNGQDIVSAGIINPVTHMVVSPTYKFNEFVIQKSRLRKIENAKKILIRARLFTPNYPTQVIKISDNDYLDIKLGMKVRINTSTK